jgi:hypothetical protein
MLSLLSSERAIKLKHQRRRILSEYEECSELMGLRGRQLIYPNQDEAAKQIVAHFRAGKSLVSLVAPPGSGKTGVTLQTLVYMTTAEQDDQCILAENAFIVSGMDDTDWKKQYTDCMLTSFKPNVFHRSAMSRESDEGRFRNITNGLILTDECHFASDSKQTMSKILRSAGLLDVNALEERNIKMVEVSATPDAVLIDAKAWGDKGAFVILKPSPIYKGLKQFYEEGRILDAPSLADYDEVVVFFQNLDNRYIGTTKKFHIFRTNDVEVQGNIVRACLALGWAVPIYHNSNSRYVEIDTLMSLAPPKHTVIIIKNFWAASKRLVDTHVGSTYKKITTMKNVTVSAQDLPARFAFNGDYKGDQVNVNYRPLHYCDKEAINDYNVWIDRGCNYSLADYTSARIRSKNGRIKRTKPSKVHTSIVAGLNETSSDDESLEELPYVVTEESFPTKRAAKDWCEVNLISGYSNSTSVLYDPAGEKTTAETGNATQIKIRNGFRAIRLEADTRKARDLDDIGGIDNDGKARIIPVFVNSTIRYIIAYDRTKRTV